MIEYYKGFKLTAHRGHIMVTDADGNFYQSADTLAEAITDIDADFDTEDMHVIPRVIYPRHKKRR